MTTETLEVNDDRAHMRFAAVQDTNGTLNAIYVNRNSRAVHYRKDPGLNDNWSRISTDVTVASTYKVGLSAIEHGRLLLYYEKGDRKIWMRRFDGAVWEPENLLYDSGGIDINDALGPMEYVAECANGVTFSEGPAPPVNIKFALGGGPCDVQAFTATSTTGQNRLQWVNPNGPYSHTRILARDDGTFPTDPNDTVTAPVHRVDLRFDASSVSVRGAVHHIHGVVVPSCFGSRGAKVVAYEATTRSKVTGQRASPQSRPEVGRDRCWVRASVPSSSENTTQRGRSSRTRRPRFSAQEVGDLEFRVVIRSSTPGSRPIRVELYTPKGHLYQELSLSFAASAKETNGTRSTQLAKATIPVSGTTIVTSSLYGKWKARTYVDGSAEPCSPPYYFAITSVIG